MDAIMQWGISLVLALILRYLRYALTIFWVIYLAPLVFLKTGWAEPQAG